MKKKIFIQILIICILFGFTILMCWRHYTQHSSAVKAIQTEMDNALEDLRKKSYSTLVRRIIEVEKLSDRVLDPVNHQRIMESCTLLAMTHAALTGNDLEAVKLFSERCRTNPGKKIELFHFDKLLPYAKFHVLNVFLKRYDMKTAHLFTNIYPKVTTGPHAPFFKALDTFIEGNIPESLKQLEALIAEDPENRMFKNTMSYIKRVEKKNLLNSGTEGKE